MRDICRNTCAFYLLCRNKMNWAQGKRGKDRKTWLKCIYNPIFICKYLKQMLQQMDFPRQLDVISQQPPANTNHIKQAFINMFKPQKIQLLYLQHSHLIQNDPRRLCSLGVVPLCNSPMSSLIWHRVVLKTPFVACLHIKTGMSN